MARQQTKTAEIQSMGLNAATLRYDVSFLAHDGRHDFNFRRRSGSKFAKQNQVGGVGVLVHTGKRFVDWTPVGSGVGRTFRRPRRPSGFRPRKVFLSYSSRHDTDGKWVHQVLSDVGHEVWHDVYDIAPGHALRTEIERGIRSSEVFVPLLDDDYVRSGWCLQELQMAVVAGVRVAPVTVETRPASFPPAIANIFHNVLGSPRLLDLRRSDVVNEMYRFAYNLGHGQP